MAESQESCAEESRPGRWWRQLSFFWWGIRWLDLPIVNAFPLMGVLLGVEKWGAGEGKRFLLFLLSCYLLGIHVFLMNDYGDGRRDPEEPRRRRRHALKYPVFRPGEIVIISLCFGLLAFAGFLLLSPSHALIALFIMASTVGYSHPWFNLKGQPVISTLIHFLGALFYFLMGWITFAPFNRNGLLFGLFFGLVLAAGHFSNEIEDFHSDLAAGLRTNAIAFGQRFVFRLGLVLFILSSLFFLLLSISLNLFLFYQFLGFALLYLWLYLAWEFRGWKGGDSIVEFRYYYRLTYAAFCGLLLLHKVKDWLGLHGLLWRWM